VSVHPKTRALLKAIEKRILAVRTKGLALSPEERAANEAAEENAKQDWFRHFCPDSEE